MVIIICVWRGICYKKRTVVLLKRTEEKHINFSETSKTHVLWKNEPLQRLSHTLRMASLANKVAKHHRRMQYVRVQQVTTMTFNSVVCTFAHCGWPPDMTQ